MRSVNNKSIGTLISRYNAQSANHLTPAGQTLVNSGLITSAQMIALKGAMQPVTPPTGPTLRNYPFRTIDANFSYPIKLKWLGEAIAIAKAEYETVWMGTTKPNARQVYRGLSRYYDINMTQDLAEAADDARLTQERAHRLAVLGRVLADDLEGEQALEAPVTGLPAQVDRAHTPLSDAGQHFVAPELERARPLAASASQHRVARELVRGDRSLVDRRHGGRRRLWSHS